MAIIDWECPRGGREYDFSKLSEREMQILSYASAGYMDKEIVVQLGVSLNTIRTYWNRIRQKLGDSSRSAFAAAYTTYIAASALTPLQGDVFAPDWEIDLKTDRIHFVSEHNRLDKSFRDAPLEDLLQAYEPEERAKLKDVCEKARAGLLDSFFLTGGSIATSENQLARSYCRVLAGENGKPWKLQGKRVAVVDVSEEERPFYDWEVDLLNNTVTRKTDAWIGHAIPVGESVGLEQLICDYHPKDQAQLRGLISCARNDQLNSFTFVGHLVTDTGLVPNGAYVFVEKNAAGTPVALKARVALGFDLSGDDSLVIGIGSLSCLSGQVQCKASDSLRSILGMAETDEDWMPPLAGFISENQQSHFAQLTAQMFEPQVEHTAFTYRACPPDKPPFWVRIYIKADLMDEKPKLMYCRVIAFH
jgi:DNA-binding CsgD family transcriptional regulator